MSLSMRALLRHWLQAGLLLIALVSLREPVVAADPNQTGEAKLSALQRKIEELDRAGKYREAIPLAQDALKLVESTVGSERPETAAACDKLSNLYRKSGDYSSAEPLCERGLKIREKVLGPDDPHTAESLDNLAQLHLIFTNFAKAAELEERALTVTEKSVGAEAPETARILHHCALVYSASGVRES